MRKLNGQPPVSTYAFITSKLCASGGIGVDADAAPQKTGSELATHVAFSNLSNAKEQAQKFTTLASDCGTLLQEILKVRSASFSRCSCVLSV